MTLEESKKSVHPQKLQSYKTELQKWLLILRLFNDAVSTAGIMQRQTRWEDDKLMVSRKEFGRWHSFNVFKVGLHSGIRMDKVKTKTKNLSQVRAIFGQVSTCKPTFCSTKKTDGGKSKYSESCSTPFCPQ